MFDKKSPEEKAAANHAKEQALLDKHGLDLNAYDEEAIRAKNVDNIRAIVSSLFGTGFYQAMTFGSNADKATVGYLGAIVQQNWIIIRQQERMIRLLSSDAEEPS